MIANKIKFTYFKNKMKVNKKKKKFSLKNLNQTNKP